ncbi:MAG: diguanylate cyclase [Pseudomonadota bacterium]
MTEPARKHDYAVDMQREKWVLLGRAIKASTLPTLLVGSIYAAFFTRYGEISLTWVWWLALVLILALRWWSVGWAGTPGSAGFLSRQQIVFGLLTATGILWGLAPVAINHLVSQDLVTISILFATGIGIAAFGSYPISVGACAAVSLPVAGMCLFVLVTNDSPAYIALALALMLMYAHQFLVVGQTVEILEREMRLRVENAVLADKVRAEADHTAAELDRRLDLERDLRAARDRAEKLSATDALTDIANRRYFDRQLKDEISRAFRDRSPLSLIICDIDHFKQYNDHYGHPAGDECLKQFAATLHGFSRRAGDVAARIGGEEFALLLPHANRAAALAIGEQVRAGIETLNIPHAGSATNEWVTASFGVATMPEGQLISPADLIAAADQALYVSKEEGRNRVTAGEVVVSQAVVETTS